MYPRFKRGGLEQHMAVQTQEFKETILIIFWTINHGLVGKKNLVDTKKKKKEKERIEKKGKKKEQLDADIIV